MKTLPGTQATGASSLNRLVVSCQTREPSLPGVWELASCSIGLPEPPGRGSLSRKGEPKGMMQTSLLLMSVIVSVTTWK